MNQPTLTLHSLPNVSHRTKKRVGRGYGSGKGGHTSGRGQKGQRSRRTIPWSFEGGALPLSHRLPFWRGKGRLNPLQPKPAIVNIGDLGRLPEGTVIDMALLVKEGFLTEKEAHVQSVKILGRGKITKKLTISGLSISMPAKAKIEKAGGEIRGKKEEGPQQRASHSRGLRPRVVESQLRGSDVPADFSMTKNQGSSEKSLGSSEKVAKTVEKAKTEPAPKKVQVKEKAVKAVKTTKKAVKKATLKKTSRMAKK